MTTDPAAHTCPECDGPVAFTFKDTSGLGAQKRGDGYNTTPDTTHYICFPCRKTWKQRADGPLTPDIVGEIAFFSCRQHGCGMPLTVTNDSDDLPTSVELACSAGHRYGIAPTEDGGLRLEDRS